MLREELFEELLRSGDGGNRGLRVFRGGHVIEVTDGFDVKIPFTVDNLYVFRTWGEVCRYLDGALSENELFYADMSRSPDPDVSGWEDF